MKKNRVFLITLVFMLALSVGIGSACSITQGPDPQKSVHDYFYSTYTVFDNDNAVDPTAQELVDFLRSDETEKNRYIPDKYTSRNFAADLHNRAEAANISGKIFIVEFEDGNIHAGNFFFTKDIGPIFIDDCGDVNGTGLDREVDATEGKPFISEPIFTSCCPITRGTTKGVYIV